MLTPVLRAQRVRREREELREELARAIGENAEDEDEEFVAHRASDDWDERTQEVVRGIDNSEIVKELSRFALSVDEDGRLVVEPNLRSEVRAAAANQEPRARVLRLTKVTDTNLPPLLLRDVALFLRDCPMLIRLPDNTRIEGSLIVDLCPRLNSLGEGFELQPGKWSTDALLHLRNELRHARPRASWENLLWAGVDTVKRAQALSDRRWYQITARRRSTLSEIPHAAPGSAAAAASAAVAEDLEAEQDDIAARTRGSSIAQVGLEAAVRAARPFGAEPSFQRTLPDIVTPACALRKLPYVSEGFAEVDCRKCPALVEIPMALRVQGDCNFQWCSSLAHLPDTVEVGGNLDLSSCKSLQGLPDKIAVAGDLTLRQSTGVHALPEVLEVGGDLKCGGLRGLRTLGRRLIVHGNLDCSALRSIEELPQTLVVERDLNCNSCVNLTSLPADLVVGGDVYLERCEALDSLPTEMLGWQAREDGEPHEVYLGSSGLGVSALEWLRNVEAPFLRFHVSLRANRQNEETVDVPPFESFAQAVAFWSTYAADEHGDPVSPDFTAEDVNDVVDDASKRGVLVFLSRLRGAKEFLLAEMRPRLAMRVLEVLGILVSDEVAREEVILRMVDSTDACDDKPIWALNQMQLLVETARARGSESRLRALARRVMNLQVVHEHAMAKCNSLGFVDDVCVYLRFEIALLEDLDLPVSALAMHFPKFMEIKDREIDAARQQALAISEEQVDAFLETWPEWQRFRRESVAAEIRWEEIPEARGVSLRRSLRDLFGQKVDEPVIFRGRQWSLPDLLRHWVAHGVDFNNVPISEDDLISGLSRPKNSRSSTRRFWSFYIE
ncbi:Disease resistance protein RPP5 [Hondaea fermentalgiana]|uniref:Disease resistance protein RPP5 n=1 Tax=Hondaea fermentalgiana TaxID=2315210 RepID=A0A2R5GHV3_9STRA|nr:Disease resistance protein RPP5 [Hondaea fermentalgiana]|eukprot:GBG27871.1 Disease resistance protein RPP5 [Hondaea fermentalgiana]